jgi:hypothetical protein
LHHATTITIRGDSYRLKDKRRPGLFHKLEPAQGRSVRNRHYRRPGQSPFALAGVPPGAVSYPDAFAV